MSNALSPAKGDLIMADVPAFDMDTFTATRTDVPMLTQDSRLNTGWSQAKWGSSITTSDFLPDVIPGNEQVLVKSGDQSIKIALGNCWIEVQNILSTHVYGVEAHYVDRGRDTFINVVENLTVTGNRTTTIHGDEKIT